MSLESALLDAVVSGPAPAGQRWLAWLVLGGEAPQAPSFDMAWPQGLAPV
ncbi:MAG: hypothetical protein KDB72_02625 [Mycobacterium sp.]|nr:hypothetical protein [Mycobacterium sp.]